MSSTGRVTMKKRLILIKSSILVQIPVLLIVLANIMFFNCPIIGQDKLSSELSFTFSTLFDDPARSPVITGIALQGSHFYVGADDRNVYKFNLNTPTPEFFAKAGNAWIRSIKFSPSQNELATLAQDGSLNVWDPQTKQRLLTRNIQLSGTHDFDYSHDGQKIAVCGYDPTIEILDARTLKRIQTLESLSHSSTVIRFSNNNQKIAVGGRGGMRLWDLVNKTYKDYNRNTIGAEKIRRIRALAFSPDDSLLAIGGDFDSIYIINVQSGKIVKTLDLPQQEGTNNQNVGVGKIYSLTFCGNSSRLVSGDSLNRTLFWDVKAGRLLKSDLGHTGTVTTVLYVPKSQTHPDGPFILSSGFDTTVIKWKLE